MGIIVEAKLMAILLTTLVGVHSAFEIPTSDSLITETLVFATKNIGLQPASCLDIIFSSRSGQSAYQQTAIINDFLIKTNLSYLIRLDDIRGIESRPPENRKFTLLLIDSKEAFEDIEPLFESRQYNSDGKHLILISCSLPDNERKVLTQYIFETLFERYIVNVVLIVRNEITRTMEFYTFFPVTPFYCFKVIPKLQYTFDGSGLSNSLNLFPRKFDNFYGCPLKLIAFEFPPHAFLKQNNDGNVQGSGIDIEVLYEIARKMNFRIIIIDSGERGIMLPNGTLTGALKLLKESQGNITVGGFGSSSKAMLQFSHSVAFLHSSMVFAIPPLQEFSPLEKLLLPFDIGVWIAILLTFGLTFLASIVLETWCKSVRDLVFGDTVKQPVFEMIIVYLGGAIVRFPTGNFARNTMLQWLIVSLILSSCYKAVLFGMLKTGFLKKYPTTIEGMLDLDFVVDVPIPLMQNLKDGPLGKRNSFFLLKDTIHKHYGVLQKGDSKRMVVDTRIQLDYFNSIHHEDGILKALPQRLFIFPMYIYFRKDSYLEEPMNKVITKFIEYGQISYVRKSVLNISQSRTPDIETSMKPLHVKDFQSCFCICSIMLGFSTVAFFFEVLSTRRTSIKKLWSRLSSFNKIN